MSRQTIKTYYQLTKPGIVYSNVMTAAAGFLFASRGHINGLQLLGLLVGIGLVIASACVFNNYIDRHIDMFMARTKKRATVTGEISRNQALTYGTVLGILGFVILMQSTNSITVLLGLIAIVTYVVVYGIAKRRSVHGTLVGTIPGALPLVAGYVTVTHSLDLAAGLLFLIMVVWQMPHFYAIAMYRRDDYAAAKLPVRSVTSGMKTTKKHIVAYVLAFFISICLLSATGYTGTVFLIVMVVVSLMWLKKGIDGRRVSDDVKWARGMFGFSLIVLLTFSFMLSIDVLLP
jgi:protoheme IX farnesyltransferase